MKNNSEDHLDPVIRSGEPMTEATQEVKAPAPAVQNLSAIVEALERRKIEDALRACHGNK